MRPGFNRFQREMPDKWTPERVQKAREGFAAGIPWKALAAEINAMPGVPIKQKVVENYCRYVLGLYRPVAAPIVPMDQNNGGRYEDMIEAPRPSPNWTPERVERLRTGFLAYETWASVLAALNALPGPPILYQTARRYALDILGLTRVRRETCREAAPNWTVYEPVQMTDAPKPKGVLHIMDLEAARLEREAYVIPIRWDGVIDWCFAQKPVYQTGRNARALLSRINRRRMEQGCPPWTVIDWHEAVKWEAVHWGKQAA